MGRGLSRQQRAILDVLPPPEGGGLDGQPAIESLFGLTIEEIAARIGRITTTPREALHFQMRAGLRPREQYLADKDRYSIWRALTSLRRRGLAVQSPRNPRRWMKCPQG